MSCKNTYFLTNNQRKERKHLEKEPKNLKSNLFPLFFGYYIKFAYLCIAIYQRNEKVLT